MTEDDDIEKRRFEKSMEPGYGRAFRPAALERFENMVVEVRKRAGYTAIVHLTTIMAGFAGVDRSYAWA